jgi:hypothetical protein
MLCFLSSVALVLSAGAARVQVENLRCEDLSNPLGALELESGTYHFRLKQPGS